MQCTSAFVVLAAIAFVITPVPADSQPRSRQVGQSRPLVLRVTPRSYHRQIPLYLVGSTYVPMNAFDPIEGVPPLGLGANNITITLPISSASCRVEAIKSIRYASPGCIDLSSGVSR
jgi:hypothetical protein